MSVAALRLDLGGDRVITAAQAYRHYRVTVREARAAGIPTVRRDVGPLARSRAARVTFLVSAGSLQRSPAHTLRHLALATTARLEVGVDAARWENEAGRTAALLVPDALWRRDDAPGGAWAVEVDTGRYSREQVRQKVLAFGHVYGFSMWITPSEQRAATLRAWLADLGAVAWVRTVRWP